MFNKKRAVALTSFAIGLSVLFACTNKVNSSPSFIFKPAPSKDAIAKVNGKVLSVGDVLKGTENEIYEAKKKVFDIKMAKVKSYLLQNFIDNHPQKKNLTNDQFLEQVIAKDLKISQKDIEAFAKERKIPQLNDELKKRIERFLMETKKREAIDAWLNKMLADSPVEIYLEKPRRPVFKVDAGDAPWTGGANAKVTIVEFSDFQCPYCAKAASVVGEIKKKYGDRVKVVFKNFPLPFHTDAPKAAQAGLCANEQGKKFFWSLHDKFFANQSNLKVDGLKSMAKEVGLDSEKFDKCLDSGKFAAQVAKTVEQGKAVSVKSTPTFFVNGQLVNGAQPLEVFSELIDEALAK